MIKAFVSLINRYGYVPNGTREYYLNRSQPPMLAQMVDIYISVTGDTKILIDVLPALKKEYNHWASTHMIKVKRQTGDDVTEHNVFRYKAKSNIARPESYRTDLQTANLFSNDTSKRTALFCEIVAATESGHDFSSRWIKGYVGPNSNPIHLLTQLNTSDVVPPELNAILYRNMQLIYKLSGIAINATNNKNLRRRYLDDQHLFKAKAEKLKSSIFDLLFDADSGMFNDWSISGNNFTGVWSPANLWPYWYLSDDINPGSISNAWESVSDIASTNPGGIPATLVNTGLQWDYPDVWAPHQYVLIKAILSSVKSISSSTNNTAAVPTTKHELSRNGTLDSEASMYYNLLSQHSELKALALQIAQSFINNAYCGWYFTGGSIPDLLEKLPNVRGDGQMFEKYDAKIIGKQAEGGEYAGQYGFGWTNGVILWLLDLFGKDLVNPTCTKHP
ncbi:Trehalase [Zancudomyces culisetae]|uniref:Trehalase n=1 Tax=Zancudomyces culisetae TaxID=1213189 RepID=A0A1R1PUS2_ZANCU|nr:Trehalase [Zancudomyces culisetae]|eukprot:OMH84730.1 Trehalase [Zancudomyces culisetae]